MARARGQRNHSDSVKQAVLAALLAGQSVGEVAEGYRLPHRTVRRWRASLGDRLAEIGRQKTDAIADLLMAYLRETLATLSAQQVFYRSPEWLIEQNARDMAMLHGEGADKAIRFLEAIESSRAD